MEGAPAEVVLGRCHVSAEVIREAVHGRQHARHRFWRLLQHRGTLQSWSGAQRAQAARPGRGAGDGCREPAGVSSAGRLGYDYGAITQAGTSQYWYFYDSRQLGEIAQQKRQLGTVAPYIMQEDSGMRGLVTGACFDEATRRLYVLRMQAYWVGRELHPLVHVYQIGKAK